MSTAATRWISPFWGSVSVPLVPDAPPGQEPQRLGAAQIFVLGLGKDGKVTAVWFDSEGQVKKHDERLLFFNHVTSLDGPVDGRGWLRIVSAGQPILAWGITPVFPRSGANEHIRPPVDGARNLIQWASMTFHPEDPLDIPDLGPLPTP